MKSVKNGLTPAKAIAVYFIVLCLVSFHEFDRIVDWVEGILIEHQASPEMLESCQNLRKFTGEIGLTALLASEDNLTAWSRNLPEVGAMEKGAGARPMNTVASGFVVIPDEEIQAAGRTLTSESGAPGSDAVENGLGKISDSSGLFASNSPSGNESSSARISDNAGKEDSVSKESDVPAKKVEPDVNKETATPSAPTAPAASKPATPAAPKPAKPVRLKPKTILIAGDSMILEGFGPALQRAFKKNYPGLKVVREGKYSSGLSRPDYFNWMPYLKKLLAKHKPDLLIVSLGANDPQDIVTAKRKRHFVASEGWNKIYGERAREFIKIAREAGVTTIWVGLPIMGQKKYGDRIKNLNDVVKAACTSEEKCEFIDTWLVLANSKNKYTTFKKTKSGKHVRLRAKDKIHLTSTGGALMAEYFFKAAEPHVEFTAAVAEVKKAEAAKGKKAEIKKADIKDKAPASAEDGYKVKVELHELQSKARNKAVSYHAFVPYKEGEKGSYPVLYLLHGAGESYSAWKEQAGDVINELVGKYGIIVIAPDCGKYGWYADSPFDKANMIETFFMKELIPDVESRYSVLEGKRGLAGLMMGGHGAFVLAIRNPSNFVSVSSISGVMDITRHHGQWELDRVFGPFNSENFDNWRRHSAYFLSVEKPKILASHSLLISVSKSASDVLADNRIYHGKLEKMGVIHEYLEYDGKNDWSYWKEQAPIHIEFHARSLSGK